MRRKQYDTRIEGIGTLPAGNYENILIEGSGKFKADITFQELRVEGMGKALGAMNGNEMNVEGTLSCLGDIKVKTLHVEGMMRSKAVKIYADEINVEGMLTNEGEVSADMINVNGLLRTPSLLGDQIRLNYSEVMKSHGFGRLFNIRSKMQGVDTIECTRLEASYLSCKRICAQEIHLSDHSHVDLIECDGDIYVDKTCTIEKMVGDYKLHQ